VLALGPHMQDRTAPCRPREAAARRAVVAAVLLFGTALAGCSSTTNSLTVFADPGKYEFHNCEQLAAERKRLVTREQELKLLMDKAEQGTGGVLVNALAYKADQVAASEELKLLELAVRAKNCETPANWRSNSAVR
jgi:hypothetical protein